MSPLDDICVVGCLFAISFVFLLCYSFCLALVYELVVFCAFVALVWAFVLWFLCFLGYAPCICTFFPLSMILFIYPKKKGNFIGANS